MRDVFSATAHDIVLNLIIVRNNVIQFLNKIIVDCKLIIAIVSTKIKLLQTKLCRSLLK